jgi:hypothetical protein
MSRVDDIVREIALPGLEFKPYLLQSFYESENELY